MVRARTSQIQDSTPAEGESSTREQKEKLKGDKNTEKPLSTLKSSKPSSSKPIQKLTMAKSKLTTTAPSDPKPGSSAKRRGTEADADNREGNKQPKNGSDPLEADGVEEKSDTKKGLFGRVWSDPDEIVLLEGAIQFKEKNGFDPSKNMAAFYDLIKLSLHFEVTQPQVKDKLWRMKKKFEKQSKKSTASFSDDHEEKSFELSQKIWSSVECDGDVKMDANLLEAWQYGKRTEQMDGMEEYVIRKGFEVLDGTKRVEVEERLTQLSVEELKLFLKRNQLVKELGEVLLEAYSDD